MFGLFKKKKPEPVEVSPDHATFYIADPSLLGSTVLDMDINITIHARGPAVADRWNALACAAYGTRRS